MSDMPDHRHQRPYVVVDVFTTNRYGGNQLAVITDGRGVSDTEMQKIANEFNFSETTFVLPPSDDRNTARVRIFTRMQEVPFAGHPNVGTAYVLGRQGHVFGKPAGRIMRFEEAAGLVDVELLDGNDGVSGAAIVAPQPLTVGSPVDPATLADCIGLQPSEIVLAHHAPTIVSVGLPFCVGEVALASLPAARPSYDAFATAATDGGYADATGRFSIFVYARTGDGCDRLRARMFGPLSGTFEDPATGSASAALGAFLASLEPLSDGTLRIDIQQGVEMGRPSEIGLQIRKSGGQVAQVQIAGRCVQTMRGVLDLAEGD